MNSGERLRVVRTSLGRHLTPFLSVEIVQVLSLFPVLMEINGTLYSWRFASWIIGGQRIAMALSCVGSIAFKGMEDILQRSKGVVFSLSVLSACVGKLCSIINTTAVERYWVKIMTHNSCNKTIDIS